MPEGGMRIGVVGATGAVGRVTLRLLRERGHGEVRAFASARSAGQTLDGDLVVEEATPEALAAGDLDLALFSVGTSTTCTEGASRRSCVAWAGESGSSSSIQSASACPTTTGTRTVVALIGSSGSSRIFRVSARIFDSSSVSSPSQLQSIARSCSSGCSPRSCSMRCAPAPDTD